MHIPIGLTDVVSALESVRSERVDRAVVPIENSIEGGVTATHDSLGTGEPLVIVGEVIVPVTFVLAVREGTKLDEIRSIGSHPHALAQCRQRLAAEFSGVTHVTTLSTVVASKELASGERSFSDDR